MRLDAESSGIQSNPAPNGAPRDRLVCFLTDETATKILQLETNPEAQGTDAFCQDWSQMRGFANPPWCLIARCLSQVKRQVARVVMVTPLWTSQPWYPTILGMLEDYPRILPARDDLVVLQTEQAFIMNQGVPVLVAWPISGNPLHQEEFLQKLQTSCYHLGDQKLSQTTIRCLQSGLAGVHKGIGIPLWDL